MVFNSTEFAIFFIVILTSFWLLRNVRILQNTVLFLGSLYFYGNFHYSFPIYLFSLISVTFLFSKLIFNTEDEFKRRVLLYLALFTLSIGLVYLKYSSLLIGNIHGLNSWQASALHLLVPVGISFYTFSSIGYIFDVYKGKIDVERNFITLGTYISFFPYLLIGPIPSARAVLPQFKKKPTITLMAIDQSIGEILWGLFKKMVVADNISLGVSYCFSHQHELNGSTLLIGVILFYLELYADFSGYSDMARGFARLLGVDIVRNFNSPFTATSITEFWRKWHISLTNWFYEYVFNPIVISLRNLGNASIAIAILLTFSLSGIWHGADWKFGVWGLLHSIAMIYENYTINQRERLFKKMPVLLKNSIGIFFTLGYAILAETFFRANSINDGIEINKKILSLSVFSSPEMFVVKYLRWCIPMLIIELIQRRGTYTFDLEQWLHNKSTDDKTVTKTYIKQIKIFVKIILYIILCYCTWLFYKRMNMAEYYYFKF